MENKNNDGLAVLVTILVCMVPVIGQILFVLAAVNWLGGKGFTLFPAAPDTSEDDAEIVAELAAIDQAHRDEVEELKEELAMLREDLEDARDMDDLYKECGWSK